MVIEARLHTLLLGAGWLHIDGFFANKFGKFYRSCGNCSQQFQRHVNITNLVGIQGVVSEFPKLPNQWLSDRRSTKNILVLTDMISGRQSKLWRYSRTLKLLSGQDWCHLHEIQRVRQAMQCG